MSTKIYHIFWIGFLFSYLLACQSKSETHAHNHDHASHEGENTEATAEVNYDCSYCGMPSQEFPKWNTKMISEKGVSWFCSPRCTFFTITNDKTKPQAIKSLEVSDYYSTDRIDAQQAFFVIHSDITGPMGHDLIPFADLESAKEFQQDHKGKDPIPFNAINANTLQEVIKQ